jgi:hypothetical protein
MKYIFIILFFITGAAQAQINPLVNGWSKGSAFVSDDIRIQMGTVNAGGNWNNVNGTTALTNLKWWSDASNSGATATMSAQTTLVDQTGTYCSSPTAPWLQGVLRYVSNHNATRTMTISNLPAGTYSVDIMATRSATAQNQTFSITGSTVVDNTIAISNNCGSDKASFTSIVVSAGGSIVITMTNTGNGFNYFNGCIVTRTAP